MLLSWKRVLWISTIGIVGCGLVWKTEAIGLNLQIGGGSKLDFSQLSVIHQEQFEENKAPDQIFWGALDVGKKAGDPWIGKLDQGAYALSNHGKQGSVRYYFRQNLEPSTDSELSQYAISVDVVTESQGEIGGAGLIFDFSPRTKQYLAFVLGGRDNRSYSVYKRSNNGLYQITHGSSPAIVPGQTNQLTVIPQGSKFSLYINGMHVTSIQDETSKTGGAGLIAISSGDFMFDNFTISTSSEAPVFPPKEESVTPTKEEPVSSRSEHSKIGICTGKSFKTLKAESDEIIRLKAMSIPVYKGWAVRRLKHSQSVSYCELVCDNSFVSFYVNLIEPQKTAHYKSNPISLTQKALHEITQENARTWFPGAKFKFVDKQEAEDQQTVLSSQEHWKEITLTLATIETGENTAKTHHIVRVIAGYERQHADDAHKIIGEAIVPSKVGWTMNRLDKVLGDMQFYRMASNGNRMPPSAYGNHYNILIDAKKLNASPRDENQTKDVSFSDAVFDISSSFYN